MMTTLEMEIALMEYLRTLPNIIVPNMNVGTLVDHECDLLSVSMAGYGTEIEIKRSKPDFLADFNKTHGHFSLMIKRFYYAVPEDMETFALEHIPERAGLIVVRKKAGEYLCCIVKQCIYQKNAKKWTDAQKSQLGHAAARRILGLKKKLLKYKNIIIG